MFRNVIITLGKDGALLWEQGKEKTKVDVPTIEQKDVVDTTGAGEGERDSTFPKREMVEAGESGWEKERIFSDN